MNTRSKKNKGKSFQNQIKQILLQNFKQYIQQGDIISTGMGQQGQDIIISPKARKFIPYSFQCKRCQSLNIYRAIQQSQNNCKENISCVVFRKNRMKPWIAIPFQIFIELIKGKSLDD